MYVDIESSTGNIDTNKIEAAITPKPTSIMHIHMFGKPCNNKTIQHVTDRYSLKVIYNATHVFDVEANEESILEYECFANPIIPYTK